ncbi:MAG: amidohydrolase [Butyrivibrio sp.]|nr:amidohydrolase [Butyrivibrio sp.]
MANRIRFRHARILTMCPGQEVFRGELWTKDERIDFIGEEAAAEKELQRRQTAGKEIAFDEVIDCAGDLLMPGFKNAHTHSAMCLMRSAADDLPLSEWLNQQIFPVEAQLTGDDIYTLTKLTIMEYLTSGMTGCMEMYLTPETVADACRDAGFRCVQVGAMNNFSQSPELVKEMYQKLNGRDAYNSYMLGFHAEYTTSEDRIRALAELAQEFEAPVWAHISETRAEVDGCIERHGQTPVSYLAGLGLFEYGGGGYHLVHVTPEDIAILKEKKMTAVTNPGSNMKLASGIAPVADYVREGIPVAIGTDGPASNNCLDMFREMFLVTGLAKLRAMDAAEMDAVSVLQMATVNGALACGWQDADVLAAGKLADLIRIDMRKPNMQPEQNIVKNIVYSGSKDNIRMTMIHGVIRYRDGAFFLDEDRDAIYEQADRIKHRIYKDTAL